MIVNPLCCVIHKTVGSRLSLVPPKVSQDLNLHPDLFKTNEVMCVIPVISVQFDLSALNLNETLSVLLFPGNANPPSNITSWFQSKGQGKTYDDTTSQIPHDIYVIGTQEDPLGEKDWIDIVRGTLRDITNISFKQVQHSIYGI